ncbi:MAG TPA: tRNA dihydrouridine synthase DusB [Bacteroidales bacterium]|nr:tRNA dihydrouridine synthase DusB [Bacteroidales bacterium]HSA42135.1 tRNA dihydrouridine synthase DusB [Bacteroidales bacterium]
MQIGNITFKDYPVILAPMEDITDAPFRFFCKRYGADLMYTEFVSSEALVRFAGKSLLKMDFDEGERPIGVQVFGHDIRSMVRATEIASAMNPDLIDINYGCPVKKVVNRGAGAGLLRDVPRMIAMTRAVVDATVLPVTVKTRLGWDEQSKNIETVAEMLQDTGIRALTIHGRTRSQLYSGKADWTLIGKVKNNPRITIPVIGNGDIDSPQTARQMIDTYGVDGIMVGRAAVGNPYLFHRIKHYLKTGENLPELSLEARATLCLEHLERCIALRGERVAVIEMRKLYPAWFRGIPGFKPYRMKLMPLTTVAEVRHTLDEILERCGRSDLSGSGGEYGQGIRTE